MYAFGQSLHIQGKVIVGKVGKNGKPYLRVGVASLTRPGPGDAGGGGLGVLDSPAWVVPCVNKPRGSWAGRSGPGCLAYQVIGVGGVRRPPPNPG